MSSPVSWSLSLCCGSAINPRERGNGICVRVVCCCVAVHNASEVQASCSPPTAVAWGPPDCITHAHIHTLVEPNMRWWESIVIHSSLTFGTFTIQTVKLAVSDLCLCIFFLFRFWRCSSNMCSPVCVSTSRRRAILTDFSKTWKTSKHQNIKQNNYPWTFVRFCTTSWLKISFCCCFCLLFHNSTLIEVNTCHSTKAALSKHLKLLAGVPWMKHMLLYFYAINCKRNTSMKSIDR